MKTRQRWTLLAALAMGVVCMPAAEKRFTLSSPVEELVTSTGSFARFAAPLQAELPTSDLDVRLRLGLQAHLALNARDAAAALAAAAALRALETDPDAKALAGLVTEAQVAAWSPGTTLSRELTDRLGRLPVTPGIALRLRNLRGKIAATTRESVLAEAIALGRRLDGSKFCDWHDADEIVRLHHRLANVLPLRGEMLAALDDVLAARPSEGS